MAPGFLGHELYDNEANLEVSCIDLSLSAMAFYPYPFLPVCETAASTWFPTISDKTSVHKRLKRTTSLGESFDSNRSIYSSGSSNRSNYSSANCLNSVTRLQFRDHIWTYTQRYHEAEAVEEAAAAIFGSSNDENTKEDGGGNRMRLVQLLVSFAKAVDCCDKSHLLTDRLAMVQPLGTVGFFGPMMTNAVEIALEKKEEALRPGHQWLRLIESLANHKGQPPCQLRIIAVDLSVKKFQIIGDELEAYSSTIQGEQLKIEQFYFAEDIKNIVSRKGPARVERHERSDQWRRRMS
ncbi:hypothetical protein LguiB_008005 [Lonicera macranthoides]